jgi:hypothetical protein
MKNRRRSITTEAPPQSSPDLTTQPRAEPLPLSPAVPDIRLRSRGPMFYVCLGVIGLAVPLVLGLLLWFLNASGPQRQTVPKAAARRLMSEEELLCESFAEKKNTGDPAAKALLPPMPAWPEAAVGQEDADHLQADLFLREVARIETVRPMPGAQRFVLTTDGNVAAPPLSVQTATGVERSQRTMTNPEIVVEVRGGLIHAVRARLGS